MKMRPVFRHGKDTPWGGRALRDMFFKPIPDELTGESLEISALEGLSSVVENGALAGMTLAEVHEKYGRALTGLAQDGTFPLLVKFLDAREMLSVQVHPGDEYAGRRHLKRGKTEAWVVLAAPEGAKLVLGLQDGADLRQAVESGALEDALFWLNVAPGDVLYIPHGLVHAVGGGLVVYEIQQSSDVTYRLWDWNRAGPDGKKRELHIDDALAVARAAPGGKLPGVSIDAGGGRMTAFVCDDNFELWRLDANGRIPLDAGRMRLLTALGRCEIGWAGGRIALDAGHSCLVPADCGAWIDGEASVLMAMLPDRRQLYARLGERAEAVAGAPQAGA
jgi:mannose-6-phosphate isomerase